MIIEWLMDLWAEFVEWFTEQMPTDEPPEFLTSIGGFIGDLAANAAGLGAWVPWSFLGVTASIILTLWVVLAGVKGLRWLWGLTPFSGGS